VRRTVSSASVDALDSLGSGIHLEREHVLRVSLGVNVHICSSLVRTHLLVDASLSNRMLSVRPLITRAHARARLAIVDRVLYVPVYSHRRAVRSTIDKTFTTHILRELHRSSPKLVQSLHTRPRSDCVE
jgi:hypothetical protein